MTIKPFRTEPAPLTISDADDAARLARNGQVHDTIWNMTGSELEGLIKLLRAMGHPEPAELAAAHNWNGVRAFAANTFMQGF